MPYSDTTRAVGTLATKKLAFLRDNPVGYWVAAMLAGAYVGVGVFLAFMVGAPMAAAASPWMKCLMGASFAVALSLVIFAGAELFTGNALVLAVGWWQRKNTAGQMLSVWTVSWLGNLAGAMLLAILLHYSGVLNDTAGLALVQKVAAKKMHLDWLTLLVRGALCNWLVCLGVWCAYRMQSETGKLVMIFWCLYAFVASGFEHCVANMTLLTLALLQPHAADITLAGMGWNLIWSTLGNIIGGAVFVGAAYWLASQQAREEYAAQATEAAASA